jgi:hypothetical protein
MVREASMGCASMAAETVKYTLGFVPLIAPTRMDYSMVDTEANHMGRLLHT